MKIWSKARRTTKGANTSQDCACLWKILQRKFFNHRNEAKVACNPQPLERQKPQKSKKISPKPKPITTLSPVKTSFHKEPQVIGDNDRLAGQI
jgi:hypothetical protein